MKFLRPPTARGDRGESLIEALVSIGILGIAVVALLGAVLMGVKSSTLHRKHAQAQSELRSWAERISADEYDSCAKPGDFEDTAPAGGQPIKVQYWNGSEFAASGCSAPADDRGLQKVTLEITVPDGIHPGFGENLDVVVRRP